jgi:parvulin-like peptidyl-prolyl isomerase
VLARLGNTILHEKDFHTWLKALAGRQAQDMLKNPAALTRPRQQYLDFQVFAAKARAQNLNKLPEFSQTMKAIESQVLMRILLDEEREGSEGKRLKEKIENPTDQEIQAYFEKNTQRYDTPEKFTSRHILVGLKGSPRMGDKGLTDEEAKAKIAKIQGELKAGKTFESLVPEYSDDPGSKTTGGLYKDVTYGRFAKQFEEAVRTQELGKVGEPVKTQFGYHLILVESRTPKQAAVLDQVRDRVKRDMIPERREALMKAFLEEYRKEVGFVAGSDAAANSPKETPKASKTPAKKKGKG